MDVWPDVATDIVPRLVELGIDPAPWIAGSPSKLDREILKQQRRFQNITRRQYERTTVTRKLNGTGKTLLVLPFFPVIEVEFIKVLAYPDGFAGYALVSGWRVKDPTGEVEMIASVPYYISVFPEGRLNIEAKWDYGFDTIPEDIIDAISLMSVKAVIERDPKDWEKEGQVSARIGDYSESYAAGDYYGGVFGSQKKRWQEEIDAVIARYKATVIL